MVDFYSKIFCSKWRSEEVEWKSLFPGTDVDFLAIINSKTWFQIGILISILIFLTSCNIWDNAPSITPTTSPIPEMIQLTQPLTEASETPVWLTEKAWVLISMGNPSILTPIEEGTLVTAIFSQNGKITGSGGCNNYNAFYEINGNNINVSPASTTKMTCANGIQQEIEFLKALEAAQSFTVSEEGRLQISYHSETGEEFLLSFIQGQYPLTNTLWVLQTYGDTSNPIPTVQGTSITIHQHLWKKL